LEDASFEEIAALFKYENVGDFLAAIGYGDISPQRIAARVADLRREAEEEEETLPEVAPPPTPVSGLSVTGVSGVMTRLARCCNPLPGEPIIGFVTRGRGVTVHRRDCPNILRIEDRERMITVSWGDDQQRVYPVMVHIRAYDRPGLLRDIADIVAGEGVNMASASVTTSKKDHTAVIVATLEITGMPQLSRILNKVERLPNVIEARRKVG
jgi:GTP pyrophosphokinase